MKVYKCDRCGSVTKDTFEAKFYAFNAGDRPPANITTAHRFTLPDHDLCKSCSDELRVVVSEWWNKGVSR